MKSVYNWGKQLNSYEDLIRDVEKYDNWRGQAFEIDASYEQQLIRKRDVFKEKTGTSQALKIIMVSAKGLTGSAYTSYISDTITLDDLFEG